MITSRRALRRSGPRAQGSQETYQVDVVVALFSVLLILLLTLSAARFASVTSESRMTYRPRDPEAAPFLLRSVAIPYPYRDVWVVKDRRFAKLDLRAVAELYVADGKAVLDRERDGVDVTLRPEGEQPDAFWLRLGIFAPGLADWLISEALPSTETDDLVAAFDRSPRGALIYVWHDQIDTALPTLQRLTDKGYPYKPIFLKEFADSVTITRNYGLFGVETILRAY